MTRESECSETPANGSEADGLTPSPASFDGARVDEADRPPLGERLPRKTRILRGNEFAVVFKNGRRSTTPALRLVLMPNNRSYARLGLAVSRGVSKRAVVRNRVKRRLREIFRRNRDVIPAGLDIVAIPQPQVLSLNFDALRAMFLELIDLYWVRAQKYGHGDPASERRNRGPRKKGKRRGSGKGSEKSGSPKGDSGAKRERGSGVGAKKKRGDRGGKADAPGSGGAGSDGDRTSGGTKGAARGDG